MCYHQGHINICHHGLKHQFVGWTLLERVSWWHLFVVQQIHISTHGESGGSSCGNPFPCLLMPCLVFIWLIPLSCHRRQWATSSMSWCHGIHHWLISCWCWFCYVGPSGTLLGGHYLSQGSPCHHDVGVHNHGHVLQVWTGHPAAMPQVRGRSISAVFWRLDCGFSGLSWLAPLASRGASLLYDVHLNDFLQGNSAVFCGTKSVNVVWPS